MVLITKGICCRILEHLGYYTKTIISQGIVNMAESGGLFNIVHFAFIEELLNTHCRSLLYQTFSRGRIKIWRSMFLTATEQLQQ